MQAVSYKRDFQQNSILAALSSQEYEQISHHLEAVELKPKQNLYNYGDPLDYVYFPLDSVVCLYTTLEDGATAEAGIIGGEGVLGISAVLGIKTVPNQAIPLTNNKALRVRADIFKQAFEKGETLQKLILQYFHALFMQISQTSACNRHHNMEGRLCRWLLMLHDRSQSDNLKITQEFISDMLGTRRPYVTTAAGFLQKEGIIECSRGNIKILDRQAMENSCCECYEIIQNGFKAFNDCCAEFRKNAAEYSTKPLISSLNSSIFSFGGKFATIN